MSEIKHKIIALGEGMRPESVGSIFKEFLLKAVTPCLDLLHGACEGTVFIGNVKVAVFMEFGDINTFRLVFQNRIFLECKIGRHTGINNTVVIDNINR